MFVVSKIFKYVSNYGSSRLHLFDQKYSKDSNIVKIMYWN